LSVWHRAVATAPLQANKRSLVLSFKKEQLFPILN
jgi:hypothetical protein